MERGAGPDLRRLVNGLGAAMRRGDADALRAVLTDDVVVEYPHLGPVFGADTNHVVLQELLAFVRLRRVSVSDVVVEGERAAFRLFLRCEATRDSDLFGAIGTKFEWSGVVFVHATGGRATRVTIAAEHSG